MKRSHVVMPRTGIRFTRGAQSAGIAGMVSGEVEVYSVTGSVERVVTGSVLSQNYTLESSIDSLFVLGRPLEGLGMPSSGFVVARTGSVPSWTNVHLGRNAAYVLPTLSASDHPAQVMNAWRSGSAPLESSAVPASASMYYSKRSTYNRITVKKSASYFDTVPPPNTPANYRVFVPKTFVAGSGTLLTVVTGTHSGAPVSADDSSTGAPATFFFDVPVRGKLVDISVWVELHHASGVNQAMPLSTLGISLQSPNVHWGSGHPFENFLHDVSDLYPVPDPFYWDSFVLWEGPALVFGIDQAQYIDYGTGLSPNSVTREMTAGWDRDFSMRTVFHDGSPIPNPRIIRGVHASGNYVGSPNSALGINNAWGASTFWTGSSGSPPAGWLSGPGGVAGVNEWPTTGSNRGAAYIKPVYPMLDPLIVRATSVPTDGFFGGSAFAEVARKMHGAVARRPGLRGTEISGTWRLNFAYGSGDLSGDPAGTQHPLYFRQARLEITYEDHVDITRQIRASRVTPRRGEQLLWNISGSVFISSFNKMVHELYSETSAEAEVGRTFGLVLNTGTLDPGNAALVYRLTGTLADYSGSAPGWLLNNPFRMPQIPVSSASLVFTEPEPFAGIHPQDLISSRPILDGARRLSEAARDVNQPKTRRQFAAELTTGSLI